MAKNKRKPNRPFAEITLSYDKKYGWGTTDNRVGFWIWKAGDLSEDGMFAPFDDESDKSLDEVMDTIGKVIKYGETWMIANSDFKHRYSATWRKE